MTVFDRLYCQFTKEETTMNTKLNQPIRKLMSPSRCAILGLLVCVPAYAEAGTATVQVITEPSTTGTVKFSGTHEGEVSLPDGEITVSGLAAGRYTSHISYVDPALSAANYQLTGILCDDTEGDSPSSGEVASQSATFHIDNTEAVTCVFKFTQDDVDDGSGSGGSGGGDDGDGGNDDQSGDGNLTCVCPQQGTWEVSNLTGQMACTGVMSMTMPLKASQDSGTIVASNGCRTLTASGMSEDEATITFNRLPNCNYKGTVGGSHEGIPMEIDFTLNVTDERNMSGNLHSVVNQQGMTCTMSREYTMRAAN